MAGGLEPDDVQGPFQPLPFYDSVILGGGCSAMQNKSPQWKEKSTAMENDGAWVHMHQIPNPTERISTFMEGWEREPTWKWPGLLDPSLPNQLENSSSHQGLVSL